MYILSIYDLRRHIQRVGYPGEVVNSGERLGVNEQSSHEARGGDAYRADDHLPIFHRDAHPLVGTQMSIRDLRSYGTCVYPDTVRRLATL